MLTITIPGIELFNEETKEFISHKTRTLSLEHSLVSISKWESKWKKPFLSKEKKTEEESRDYIRCMTLTQNVKPETYKLLTSEIFEAVSEYIDDTMTATTINDNSKETSNAIITAEIIYYWMSAMQIPVEFQKWHLNKLLTLINVTNIKNQPPKKRSKAEIISRNRKLNEERRKKLNSKG